MTLRSWFCRRPPRRASNISFLAVLVFGLTFLLIAAPRAHAGDDAPQWMHALVSVPLPPHDEETDAVLLYSEEDVSLQSANSLKVSVRRAYKILRPSGRRDYGNLAVDINAHRKVSGMQAWCIPATGRDYHVKDKEAVEVSPAVDGGDLITDVKFKVISIPAAEPASIVGYEYQTEETPLILQSQWEFQDRIPAVDTRYSLELPVGWTYVAKWANYPESQPTQAGNHWQWELSNVKQIRKEEAMPPVQGVAGQMIVYFVPPGEKLTNYFSDWREMGEWYRGLTAGRVDASPEIKQTVAKITASSTTSLAKMQAVAQYIQQNLRYVAIELGIGGFQPHSATETFAHRYGDCKDKATITISMLREIGVESYYVIVNSRRGAVTKDTPPHIGAFDHAIVAIRLPEGVSDPSLLATVQHPKYGKLLFFDPTDELTPFGALGSYLQASYGMLVAPDGGELIQLPTQAATTNTIQRTAKLSVDGTGTLKGDVDEIREGDRAWAERSRLREATKEADRLSSIEDILSSSLTGFQITHASIQNIHQTSLPFGFKYSFVATNYAKNAGGLILVRPRVLGIKAVGLAQAKHPREYPFEFHAVLLDTDSFDIAIPPGYAIDDLPAPADIDYSFGSYHSSTVVDGGTIHYRRSYEIKQLTVPVDQANNVKNFYQIIAGDERSMVVLKPAQQ
jgi:hypothetical protein